MKSPWLKFIDHPITAHDLMGRIVLASRSRPVPAIGTLRERDLPAADGSCPWDEYCFAENITPFAFARDPGDLGWRCFHCAHYFQPHEMEAAREHFGLEQDGRPYCLDHGSDAELLRRARGAEIKHDSDRHAIQCMHDEIESLGSQLSAWQHCFRKGMNTPSEAWHHYDFMEGRALVALEKVDHARREIPLLWNVVNCLEAGMTGQACAEELRLILARLTERTDGGGKPSPITAAELG